jgi:hypothetical protein
MHSLDSPSGSSVSLWFIPSMALRWTRRTLRRGNSRPITVPGLGRPRGSSPMPLPSRNRQNQPPLHLGATGNLDDPGLTPGLFPACTAGGGTSGTVRRPAPNGGGAGPAVRSHGYKGDRTCVIPHRRARVPVQPTACPSVRLQHLEVPEPDRCVGAGVPMQVHPARAGLGAHFKPGFVRRPARQP